MIIRSVPPIEQKDVERVLGSLPGAFVNDPSFRVYVAHFARDTKYTSKDGTVVVGREAIRQELLANYPESNRGTQSLRLERLEETGHDDSVNAIVTYQIEGSANDAAGTVRLTFKWMHDQLLITEEVEL